MRNLVWFRRDLRVSDNKAFSEAARLADDGVVGVFLVTPGQWKEHDDANCKVKFWLDNVASLSDELDKLNIPLIVATCDRYDDVPKTIMQIARKHRCEALFWNREYEVNEVRRDEAVAQACHKAGVSVSSFDDRVIVPPTAIRTQQGKFYSVFTPYRRVWEKRVYEFLDPIPKPGVQAKLDIERSAVPKRLKGFPFGTQQTVSWVAGEQEAHSRLESFSEKIFDYHFDRDIPATPGTSLLSPYLAAGVISPRQCLGSAMACNRGKVHGHEGPMTWISELAWRDFYTQVLVACPRVSMHRPFKLNTNAIEWRTCQKDFDAWCRGETGFPIVDAGMRQLNQTGWMHNRLRMVTAMFLTKIMMIDWRWGEQYFMQNLIDGDLAANNGGWQWSASTGTDSVPYFRIFNPFSQSKRFDPEGTFIKNYCPELDAVPKAALHDPLKLTKAIQSAGVSYPEFAVDYKSGRERTLQAFKSLNN